MTNRAVASWILFAALLAGGCATQPTPQPGASCAKLTVEAKPKSGVKQRVARVPVYDAAPRPTSAKGQFELVDYSSLGNIIVWIEPAPLDGVRKPALDLAIDAAHPSTELQPASVGQEIVFHNKGSAPLSLYSVSDNNDFDLPSIPAGAEGRYTVRGEGLIEILADPSQPPIALVYAAPSPRVAAARTGQTVIFNNVAPGSYRAVAWHPRLPGKSIDLALSPDRVCCATITIGVNNIASPEP
jgi:hypothetical protein